MTIIHNYLTMRQLFILFIAFLPIASAQIVVDGDASEWTGALPGIANISVYRVGTAGQDTKLNEWIWQDATSDHRTDLSSTGNDDLLEVRLASDTSVLYYMFKITPGFTFQPMFQITLRLPSSNSTQTYLGGFADTQVPSSAAWDYLVMTQNGGTSNIVYNSSWSTQASGSGAASSSNGVVEGRVPWSSLGGPPNAGSYVVTITSYRESGGGTVDIFQSNCLDLVTTNATTWSAVSSGTIDYSTNIEFLSDNQVLPVELTSFQADRSTRGIQISWTTATEIENAGFELERKAAGDREFTTIAFIPGSGTSFVPRSYVYEDLQAGEAFTEYRLKQIDADGTAHVSRVIAVEAVGTSMSLQSYPNPSNPSTTIDFYLPFRTNATLEIFDALGRHVKTLVDSEHESGRYNVQFDGSGLASGVYLYRLQAGGFVQSKKLILLR
jgi:hypothetical protein